MKSMSVEHLFVKPVIRTIMGKEIEVKPIKANEGLLSFSQFSSKDKKAEAMKEIVWMTIKETDCYTDLPESREEFFDRIGLGALMDWLNAAIEANHLGDFVDKKKAAEDISQSGTQHPSLEK